MNSEYLLCVQTILALREVTESTSRVTQLEAIVHLQGEQLEANDTLIASLRDEIAALSAGQKQSEVGAEAEAAETQEAIDDTREQQQQELAKRSSSEIIENLKRELSSSRAELEEVNGKVRVQYSTVSSIPETINCGQFKCLFMMTRSTSSSTQVN